MRLTNPQSIGPSITTTKVVYGVIISSRNASGGVGYTRFYHDGTTQWAPLAYTADVMFETGTARLDIGRPSCPDWTPPVIVRALQPGHVITGIEVGGSLLWLYQELPAVGCEP